ncbi:hypothetical protein [Thermostilla marina]
MTHRNNLATCSTHLPLRRWYALLLLILATSAVIRVPYLFPTFGEDDAAGIAVVSVLWNTGHISKNPPYVFRTSPAYILLLSLAQRAGLPLELLPHFMTAISFIGGLGATAVAAFFSRRIVGPWASLFGAVLLQLGPGFWFGTLYGMPHVPSLALVLSGGYLIANSSALASAAGRLCVLTLGSLLIAIAVPIKADIILIGPGLVLLTFAFSKSHPRFDALIVAVAFILGIVGTLLVTNFMVPATQSDSLDFASKWQQTWPASLCAFFDGRNLGAIAFATGPLILVAGCLGITVLTFRNRSWLLTTSLALWIAVPVFFWGIRPGNSVRHLVAGMVFIPFFAAYAICLSRHIRHRLVLALALVVAHVFFPWLETWPRPSTTIPSCNVFSCADAVRTSWLQRQQRARDVLLQSGTQPILFYGGNDCQLGVFEALTIGHVVGFATIERYPAIIIRTTKGVDLIVGHTHRRSPTVTSKDITLCDL